MKKILLLILAFSTFTVLSAQTKNSTLEPIKDSKLENKKSVKKINSNRSEKGNEFFCEDFSNGFAGNNPFGAWSIEDNGPIDTQDVLIEGSANDALFNTGTFESTSVANGYVSFDVIGYILDNDLLVNNIGPGITAYLTMPELNMSELSSAIVTWESYYYYCCANVFPLSLEVSIDNGANWEIYEAGGTSPANVNVYSTNGEELTIDISALAAGQESVMIRFAYNSELSPNFNDAFFAYFWAIDDVCITEKPENDIQVNYSVVTQKPADFIEYGRVPLNQIDEGLSLSVNVYNFGLQNQTNVSVTANFTNGTTTINETVTLDSIVSDQFVDIDLPIQQDLTVGIYEGTFTIVSDQEIDGPNFSNNVNARQFEITDGLYSQDGIDVYSTSNTSTIGPGSFLNADDDDNPYDAGGLLVQYDLRDESLVSGVRVLLAGAGNVGTQLFSFMADTADVLADDLGNKLTESDLYTITNADASAGYVDLLFIEPLILSNNTYYAGIQVESGGADFRIFDDQTIPQPGVASVIFLDGTFTNGVALGIQLYSTWIDAVDEIASIDFTLSQNIPNPANNSTLIEYHLTKANKVSLNIVDVTGKLVKTINKGVQGAGVQNITIDVSGLASGVYTYTLIVGESKISKQLIKE